MTTLAQPIPAPGALATAWARIWRARRLVERNIMVYRHQWIIIFSGVFEPIFYLIGIGLGIGGIVREIPLADGRVVAYAAYVAPALLATAAMNGAVFETIFNVFFKLNYAKTYDGVLATPMGITEIALGEMMWALMRAALYAVAMFVIMFVTGLILSPLGPPHGPGRPARRRRLRGRRPGGHLLPAHGQRLRRADGPGRDADVPVQRHVLPDRASARLAGGSCRSSRCTTRSASSAASRPGSSAGQLGTCLPRRLLRVCMWIAMRQMERKLIK